MTGTAENSRPPKIADRFDLVRVGTKRYLATTFPLAPDEDPAGVADTANDLVEDWKWGRARTFPIDIRATLLQGDDTVPGKDKCIYFYLEIPSELNPDDVAAEAVDLTDYLASVI